jgi:hypothetical protein
MGLQQFGRQRWIIRLVDIDRETVQESKRSL